MNAKPIFVHSLFRSGSTYIFNVFRRSAPGYWCYQEPFHEYIRYAKDAPERLLEIHSQYAELHHPKLQVPYFWEFYQIREAIGQLFKKELSYDWFFIGKDHPSFPDVIAYLQCLINVAKGRPLLQFCRSFGRVAGLRETCEGFHIHLWRNPWDQWWSYKVGDYFDATTVLILNALTLPPVLTDVKNRCRIVDFHDEDVEKEIMHAQTHRLASHESYLAFYALWLYSFLETEKVADLSINIDSLSSSAPYRASMLAALTAGGIAGLDLSDCKIFQTTFNEHDRAFFDPIENDVQELFLRHGYEKKGLDAVAGFRNQHPPASEASPKELLEAVSRLRQVAIRTGDCLAEAQRCAAERERILADAGRLGEAQREELAVVQQHIAEVDGERAQACARLRALETELAEASTRMGVQREELAAARQHVAQVDAEHAQACERLQVLEHELADASAHVDAQSRELVLSREHAQRLENEWNAASTKIDELRRLVHHWWAAADGASRALQALHTSRSWRLTAPLRKGKFLLKEFARITKSWISTLPSLPPRAARRMLVLALAHLQLRPKLKAEIERLLAALSPVEARHAPDPSDVAVPTIASGSSATKHDGGVPWAAYPSSVRRVHQQLMHARATVQAPAPRTDPPQRPA